MEAFSEETSKMIKYEEKGSTHGPTADLMKDSGNEISLTGKANMLLPKTSFLTPP